MMDLKENTQDLNASLRRGLSAIRKANARWLMAGCSALFLAVAQPSMAIAPEAAQEYVSQATVELQQIVNSGQTGGALESSLRGFFRQYADVPTVARAVIGAPWRGMNNAQKDQYVSAFEDYVVRKYAKKFDVLKGGEAHIDNTRQGGPAGVMVVAEFVRSVGLPVGLDFQVSDQSGNLKILDLRLEGVSLISQEREAVRAMLEQNGGDVDALIAALNAA